MPGALQMQAKVEDALSGAMVNCYGGGDGGMARRRWRDDGGLFSSRLYTDTDTAY